jgi:CDP-paratose 2-epimerase
MSKLLVTGSAGFIGTNVTIEAINRGYTVVGFDNLHRPQTEENLKYLQDTYKDKFIFVHGDIRNESDFERIPESVGAIHLAGQCGIPYAQINPRYDFEVNVLGTINLLELSRYNGKFPIAFAASNKCYTNIVNDWNTVELETRYEWGAPRVIEGNSISEELPLDAFGKYARSLYGTSKVSADLYCQEYYQAFGVPTVINRMSCIYGLFQKGSEDQAWIDHFVRKIGFGDGKLNIFSNGKQVRDMLWGEDVARLYLDEIENIDKVAGKPYNIGGGVDNTMSLLEAIKEIEDQTGRKAELTFLDKRHGDQDIWISDITKIKTDLGWSPTISPKEGIKRIIEQYLQ